MKTRDDIFRILQKNQEHIRSYGVRNMSLFGSYARNEATKQSDLDFLVDFEVKSFDGYMGLKLFLEELFNQRVDVVLRSSVKPRLSGVIEKEAIHVPGL